MRAGPVLTALGRFGGCSVGHVWQDTDVAAFFTNAGHSLHSLLEARHSVVEGAVCGAEASRLAHCLFLYNLLIVTFFIFFQKHIYLFI